MKLPVNSVLAGLALALALGTAAYAADIKIGVLVPTTGGQATYGQDMANAVQLAMDELNKAGGGNTYSAVVGDDGCDPQQAVNAATKLASSGIAGVVGGYCSGATIPTLKIFGDAKLPFVITAANSTKLIPANPGNAFMINSTGNDQVAKALDVWKAKGVKSLAIVNEGDAYSQDLATLAQKSFTDAGGTVADFETVNKGEQDFSAVVTKIKAANPDAVFWTAYDDDGGPFIKQLREGGYQGAIYRRRRLDLGRTCSSSPATRPKASSPSRARPPSSCPTPRPSPMPTRPSSTSRRAPTARSPMTA